MTASPHNRGFSLLEMTLSLSIGGILMGSIWQISAITAAQSDYGIAATQALAVAQAGQGYINSNASTLLALGGLSTLNSTVRIKLTASDSGATTTNVQDSGFLPSNFTNINSYGQSYALYVQRVDSGTLGSADSGDRLVGFLITTGGQEISDQAGARIASAIGAPGGFLYAADNPASPTAATTARGAVGGWSISLSAAAWTGTVGATATRGHLAILASLLPGSPALGVGSSSGSGAAISAIDDLSDGITNYTTDMNLFIGSNAGAAIASGGTYNTGIGISALAALTTGDDNTALGRNALAAMTTGTSNTGIGTYAGATVTTSAASNTLIGNEAGRYFSNPSNNTALGSLALMGASSGDPVTGGNNLAIGYQSLKFNNSGTDNTALGANALYSLKACTSATAAGYMAMYYANSATSTCTSANTALGAYALRGGVTASSNTGNYNTAAGHSALMLNTTGAENTATGYLALSSNTTATGNTAFGSQALKTTSTSGYNTAVGYYALYNNTAISNTALGWQALKANTTGTLNTALGRSALEAKTSGNNNTAAGAYALQSGISMTEATALGAYALQTNTGTGSTAIGYYAGKTATNGGSVTAIGFQALAKITTQSSTTAVGSNGAANGNSDGLFIGAGTAPLSTAATSHILIGAKILANATSSSFVYGIGAETFGNTSSTSTLGVAIGYQAMRNATNGSVAIGTRALYGTTDTSGIAIGYEAYYTSTSVTGSYGVAIGYQAGYSANAGRGRVFLGSQAGRNLTGGNATVAGYMAGYSTTTAQNSAAGSYALFLGGGTQSTAIGASALMAATSTANYNTALGYQSLAGLVTGTYNTAIGTGAGYAGAQIGTGNSNTLVGYNAQSNSSSYSNGSVLGYNAVLTGSNRIVLGNSSITAIYAAVTSITAISDRRHKKDIRDVPLGLDFIMALKPRQFRLNNGDDTLRYGFIAQEIEQALPDDLRPLAEKPSEDGLALISRDNDDKRTYRVSYGELISPMVSAVQSLDNSSRDDLDDAHALQSALARLNSRLDDSDQELNRLLRELSSLEQENAKLRAQQDRARGTP
jgi:prepilin-type N-terminal cleavage/methylation domain-containing protein